MATKQHHVLPVEPRQTFGKHTRALRRDGVVPGNIFGRGTSQAIQINLDTFERMRAKHQTSGLLELQIHDGSQPVHAFVRALQVKPKTGHIVHISFERVSLTETMEVKVPLHLIGDAPVIKIHPGMMLLLLEDIEIKALPGDVPDALNIDVSHITETDTILHVADIKLPAGVSLLTNGDEPIVKFQHLRSEEAAGPSLVAPEEPKPETPTA